MQVLLFKMPIVLPAALGKEEQDPPEYQCRQGIAENDMPLPHRCTNGFGKHLRLFGGYIDIDLREFLHQYLTVRPPAEKTFTQQYRSYQSHDHQGVDPVPKSEIYTPFMHDRPFFSLVGCHMLFRNFPLRNQYLCLLVPRG